MERKRSYDRDRDNGAKSGVNGDKDNYNSPRESSNYVAKTNLVPYNEVDNLRFIMGKIEMVKKSIMDKGLAVEGSELVKIPIAKESHRTSTSKGQVTWRKNLKAAARKQTNKSTGIFELSKKRKTGGEGSTNEAKKKCEVEHEVLEATTVSLVGIVKDQPCHPL